MTRTIKANPEIESRDSKKSVLAVMTEGVNEQQLKESLQLAKRLLSRPTLNLLPDSQLEVIRDIMENPKKYADVLRTLPEVFNEMAGLRQKWDYYSDPNVVKIGVKMLRMDGVSLKPYKKQIERYKIKM